MVMCRVVSGVLCDSYLIYSAYKVQRIANKNFITKLKLYENGIKAAMDSSGFESLCLFINNCLNKRW